MSNNSYVKMFAFASQDINLWENNRDSPRASSPFSVSDFEL